MRKPTDEQLDALFTLRHRSSPVEHSRILADREDMDALKRLGLVQAHPSGHGTKWSITQKGKTLVDRLLP